LDSDLAESFGALKQAFDNRHVPVNFDQAPAELIANLKVKLGIPRRYRDFLSEKNPVDCETRTPSERVRLVPADELLEEQEGFALEAGERIDAPRPSGWKPSWVIIGHSSLLGDPYFIDTGDVDPEGDCPVYTAMSGTDSWQPRLCASSFALFLRVLAVAMEVASGFSDSEVDYDDEFVFREALESKLRSYDPAAVKAGHWT
jgi:hypothetical protein